MAQSNHSVEIEVTAQTAQAKKDLQEIEKMLNRLSQGAKVGLGAGGGGRGGSGGGGSAPAAMSKQAFSQQVALQAAKTGDKRLLEREKRVTKQVAEEEKRRTASHKETIDQNKQQNSLYAKQQESFLKRDTKAHEEEQKRITATHKHELQSRLEAQKQYYKEQNRAAKDAAAEAKRVAQEKAQAEKKAAAEKKQRDKAAVRALEQLQKEEDAEARRRRLRNLALVAGGAYLANRTASFAGKTITGAGGASSIEGTTSGLLSALGRIPLVGSFLEGGGQSLLEGARTRTALQQNVARFQPSMARISTLTGMGRQEMMGGAGSVAASLGIGPERFFQQLSATSAGAGRRLSPVQARALANLGLTEEALGGDAQSALSFIRSATLGRRRGGAGSAFSELGRIESFRQAQGLLPAESSMLRQAGAAFRQQGLAQGFAIDESSLFGLTQGIMSKGRSGAAQSLTGAMGLAQRERQLGFGAFQDFAGQFADLPNTLLLARAAQGGGGIGGIFRSLSKLSATPGVSAKELSTAVSQFNIPRELIQAGVASRLGVGFGAAGDVLRARKQGLAPAAGIPEVGVFTGQDLGLARTFAGAELGKLQAGLGFTGEGSVQTLSSLLSANVKSEERLALLTEKQTPELIKQMSEVNKNLQEATNVIADFTIRRLNEFGQGIRLLGDLKDILQGRQ